MTASRDPGNEATPRSRRAILAGALGGIGAWAAATVGSRTRVAAANGDPILIGQANAGSATTSLTNSSGTVFDATAAGSATAISAYSPDATAIQGGSENGVGVYGNVGQGIGVYGNSNGQSGVWGQTDGEAAGTVGWSHSGNMSGVMGMSGDPVDQAPRPKTGVYGLAEQDAGSRGVVGVSPKGQGVRGEATSGVGLFGTATSGFALQAAGRAKFSTSGVASIPAGSTSVTVTPGVNIVGGSFVLLTPMANLGSRGLWFTKNETANTFTIRMSSSRSGATKVAWLLLG